MAMDCSSEVLLLFCYLLTYINVVCFLTTMLFLDTQQSAGKSCSIGTMKVRQPSQWHSSSIIPIRLTIRTTALAKS